MLKRGEALDAQIDVVPNGIADPKYAKLEDAATVRARYGVAPGVPLVVALCRLEREKEVDVLLRAWAKVAGKRPDARLIIGGRGALQSELSGQIERDDLSKSAQLVGFVDDALSLLNAADIFAHPAPAEPFGLVFLEAMALGKPIVACEGGAAPEIVGDAGYLCSPSRFEPMASALSGLINNAKHQQRLGRIGRARFLAHFKREQMAAGTLAVYQKAIQQ